MFSNSDMEELFELISKVTRSFDLEMVTTGTLSLNFCISKRQTINYKYNVSQIMNNWLTKEG